MLNTDGDDLNRGYSCTNFSVHEFVSQKLLKLENIMIQM